MKACVLTIAVSEGHGAMDFVRDLQGAVGDLMITHRERVVEAHITGRDREWPFTTAGDLKGDR